MKLHYSIEDADFRKELKDAEQSVDVKMERLAQTVAEEVVNNARSLTNKTVPGAATNSEGTYQPVGSRRRRKAHPGGWGDITSNLAESINSTVKKRGFTIDIIIEATRDYAAALDAKTGYDVLGGAGIAARKALRKHAPQFFDD
jgi:hypothetical protein